MFRWLRILLCLEPIGASKVAPKREKGGELVEVKRLNTLMYSSVETSRKGPTNQAINVMRNKRIIHPRKALILQLKIFLSPFPIRFSAFEIESVKKRNNLNGKNKAFPRKVLALESPQPEKTKVLLQEKEEETFAEKKAQDLNAVYEVEYSCLSIYDKVHKMYALTREMEELWNDYVRTGDQKFRIQRDAVYEKYYEFTEKIISPKSI